MEEMWELYEPMEMGARVPAMVEMDLTFGVEQDKETAESCEGCSSTHGARRVTARSIHRRRCQGKVKVVPEASGGKSQ